MKYFLSLTVAMSIVFSGTVVNAISIKKGNAGILNGMIVDSRIETINEHAFFILTLEKEDINISYGDKVELFFGLNTIIAVYNISGGDNLTFKSNKELVVFIAPEDLRCFKNKTLRKVKIHTGNKTLVIKANIGPDQLKIK